MILHILSILKLSIVPSTANYVVFCTSPDMPLSHRDKYPEKLDWKDMAPIEIVPKDKPVETANKSEIELKHFLFCPHCNEMIMITYNASELPGETTSEIWMTACRTYTKSISKSQEKDTGPSISKSHLSLEYIGSTDVCKVAQFLCKDVYVSSDDGEYINYIDIESIKRTKNMRINSVNIRDEALMSFVKGNFL